MDAQSEIQQLSTMVDALSAMSADEQRRALNYLNARFGDTSYTDADVDALADVLVDAHTRGIGFAGGAVRLAEILLDAGYRRSALSAEEA